MAELLLDLFSEEIPAYLQESAAADLLKLLQAALAPLNPRQGQAFSTPRHVAAVLEVDEGVPERLEEQRGPRLSAPPKALAGFLRKHGVAEATLPPAAEVAAQGAAGYDLGRGLTLRVENDYWVLAKRLPAVNAAALVAEHVPEILWNFPWPKTMRWGQGTAFTWIRPLRRIACLLDGQTVPFSLERAGDKAHGLAASNQTEGHRFMAPGPFTISSAEQWRTELAKRFVLVDPQERQRLVREGAQKQASAKGAELVPDEGLVREVAGLTEWPVPLAGAIEAQFMDLPPEVMQVSMRVNQRYFATRQPGQDQQAAPWFVVIANKAFDDGGALCIAGNERVLRARFADARHFWNLDRKRTLASRVDDLGAVTFHAKLGTQKARAERISRLAGAVAAAMGLPPQQQAQAERAGLLAKADLTTGMVGEFPEVQGVMGGHYARHDGEGEAIADAVGEHYMPRGAQDNVPSKPVSVAVALADRLDMLAGFFAMGETPTGSGDPYGLRRAAIAVIRLVRDNGLHINLDDLLTKAAAPYAAIAKAAGDKSALQALEGFLAERLKVQLRSEGQRHDVLDATLASSQPRPGALFSQGLDGDLTRLLARVAALAAMLETPAGAQLLQAYKRAGNILRIENKKDGPHKGAVNEGLFQQGEERRLAQELAQASQAAEGALGQGDFQGAMKALAPLQGVMEDFFGAVTVNADDPALRRNRLRLLQGFVSNVDRVADFSKLTG
ncbi:glycine--tRNA ligase subunit beta [Formicincola oecophyllae]|uniref:Glycine--tRNA ligase beta subunit n=1 Tax=Formicincola oecophyllae TaxID=2558361 RepID=A0A4Y6U8Y5_9PROT|nr:glycine--tRNA ligase subunit beta [Formicincola oecophyllae]QDH13842.1 glycine--tRNA ligase subunit beta [Formicincola oecophyllae]